MKYLDVSETIAVDHITRVVNAAVLAAGMTPASSKALRDQARAVRLFMECREYAAAVESAKELRRAFTGLDFETEVHRVIDRCLSTLEKRVPS